MTSNNQTNAKLDALRHQLNNHGVDGYIVPHSDEYLGEHLPPSAERLHWLSNFSGSAGVAIILKDKAAIFTDSRYIIQIQQEINTHLFTCHNITSTHPVDWCVNTMKQGDVLGYDPRLHTRQDIDRYCAALAPADIQLTPLPENLIDAIWQDKPQTPQTNVQSFPIEFAGQTFEDKYKAIYKIVETDSYPDHIHAVVLTQPDSIAWLLNIRGHDIPHTPVALSYAIIYFSENGKNGNSLLESGVRLDWFIDPSRVDYVLRKSLEKHVRILKPDTFKEHLSNLAKHSAHTNALIQIDTKRSPIWCEQILQKHQVKIKHGDDPCVLPRACKNDAEITAMRQAHITDAIAYIRFLMWFDQTITSVKDFTTTTPVTELDIIHTLHQFRRDMDTFCENSFDTIAGFAENGAIVHYRATQKTNKTLVPGNMLLLDSGGQYKNGTTDITRTLPVGSPPNYMRDHYTYVLKGHISLATAQFPQGTIGAQLDTLAREPLWNAGLDYGHGTGHGVGCYLSVHEEAASISPRGYTPLMPGMILSNEPGFYKENAYGIRIENLVVVRETGKKLEDGRRILELETITMVPIDTSLINASLLNSVETQWINTYHTTVFEKISPYLNNQERNFLAKATKAI